MSLFGAVADSYVASGGGGGYAATVLADSPLGYWRLGESSGTTAADASGNSRPLAYSGIITYGRPSLLLSDPDTAVLFNSSTSGNGKASAADASWMHPTAFTIEAWVQYNGFATGSTQCIASKTVGGTVNATNYQFMFYKPATSTNIAVIVQTTSGNVTLVDTTSFLGTGSSVRHVVATYDGSTVKLYGNGSLLTSTSLTGNLAPSTSSPLVIADTGGGSRQFCGDVDEVAYYGSALSSTRVAAHYAAR